MEDGYRVSSWGYVAVAAAVVSIRSSNSWLFLSLRNLQFGAHWMLVEKSTVFDMFRGKQHVSKHLQSIRLLLHAAETWEAKSLKCY